MSKLSICIAALIATSAATGCTHRLEEDLATAAITSALETPKKQNASREIADAMAEDCDAITAEQAAAEAAARPTVGLFPSGCLDKTADGSNLHAEFNGCTGSFGYVELNGGLDADLSVVGACQLEADIVDSGDLTANGEALDYQAHADIEVRPGERDIDWQAHWIGTTPRGRTIEQNSDLNVLVAHATSCLTIDGETHGEVGAIDYDTAISGMTICPEQCPGAGTIEANFQGYGRERSVSIAFDGSNIAQVTGWSGRTFQVEMVCETGEVVEPEAEADARADARDAR